jgi:hypothetical protein
MHARAKALIDTRHLGTQPILNYCSLQYPHSSLQALIDLSAVTESAIGRSEMKRNRHQRNLLLGSAFVGATAIGFSTPAMSLADADLPAACEKLATLTSFPISPTQITLAKFNPAGATSGERQDPSGSLSGARHHQQAHGR